MVVFTPLLIYLIILVAAWCAFLVALRYEKAKRAQWGAKRTEAIECALSLRAAIDSLSAEYEESTPMLGTTNQLNKLGELQNEVCNILEQLQHYKPNRTVLLLDSDMSSIEQSERRLNDLSKRIRELQRVMKVTT